MDFFCVCFIYAKYPVLSLNLCHALEYICSFKQLFSPCYAKFLDLG